MPGDIMLTLGFVGMQLKVANNSFKNLGLNPFSNIVGHEQTYAPR